MILTDNQIARLCLAGMVSPYEPALINPASLDVRLGPDLLIESAESRQFVPLDISEHTQFNPFMLVPGQFVLGATIEMFHLPDTIAAQFMLKSSRAREGLEHLLAGFCDPGWHGSTLTLELHNSRQLHPVAIWPDMRIGQMVFHQLASPVSISYAEKGRYNEDRTVTQSKG